MVLTRKSRTQSNLPAMLAVVEELTRICRQSLDRVLAAFRTGAVGVSITEP
jgi:hypothetical protein